MELQTPLPPRKKLLIFITKSNFGGAQRYVYDLARSLKSVYDVTVACGGEGLMRKKLEDARIKTVSIPFAQKNLNPLKDLFIFFWAIRFIMKEHPVVVHANSSKMGGLSAGAVRVVRWLSYLKTRKNRAPIKSVFTAHAWAFNEDRSSFAKIIIKFFHWFTVFLSDETIAVSNAVKSQLAYLPFIGRKMRTIHLGLEPFRPLARVDARAELGIDPKAFVIGTIAELHPVKGLDYALDAIAETSFETSYMIIGEGDERNNLEARIAKNPTLQKRVVLKGFVKDAAKYISAFDIFLLPSLSEAFGYVILEAGYSKVPVIATSVGGIPEIIEDMKSGILIHARKPKEISRAVSSLYEDEMRKRLGTALYEKAKTEFSLEKMVMSTLAVYEGKN